jgi:hypothetical protein
MEHRCVCFFNGGRGEYKMTHKIGFSGSFAVALAETRASEGKWHKQDRFVEEEREEKKGGWVLK